MHIIINTDLYYHRCRWPNPGQGPHCARAGALSSQPAGSCHVALRAPIESEHLVVGG